MKKKEKSQNVAVRWTIVEQEGYPFAANGMKLIKE